MVSFFPHVAEIHVQLVTVSRWDGKSSDSCTWRHWVYGAFGGRTLDIGIANIVTKVHTLSIEAAELSEEFSRDKESCTDNNVERCVLTEGGRMVPVFFPIWGSRSFVLGEKILVMPKMEFYASLYFKYI